MKKFISLILVSIMIFMSFGGCRNEEEASIDNADSYIEEIGIVLELENISPTGATVTYNQYEEKTSGELQYGEDFIIEKRTMINGVMFLLW